MAAMPGAVGRRRLRLALLLSAAGALVLLAVAAPALWTWWQGRQAQQSLEAAVAALQDGDAGQAREHVAEAGTYADRADVEHGTIGWAWGRLPVLAQNQDDAARLADALQRLTEVAEIGVALHPRVSGDEGDLVDDGRVDLDLLDDVLQDLDDIESRVRDAELALERVGGDGPILGGSIAELRDEGLEGLEPVTRGLATLGPLADRLPAILGAEGARDYLVAILNPAEQLYSGGTPLTFTPMSVREGRIEMGTPQDTATHGVAYRPRYWKKVPGNPFHRGKLRIATAAFAPDWAISGEETLRAWRSLRSKQMDGLIAIDVMALRDLVAITGPLDVPYYGEIHADNFVQTLIGSYDSLRDYRVRHQINQALVPIFRDRFFATGRFVEKLDALHRAARGRHFAVYFRDPADQRAFADVGLTGELSDTEHDYLGVFTQNAVPSKTDYWQSRTVTSDVQLHADGSARVTVTTAIHNDSTPYPFRGRDPRTGYSTRFAHLSVAQFLPRGATNVVARVDEDFVDLPLNDFYGRPFVRRRIDFRPQATHVFATAYDVPRAAVVRDGELAYRLDVDPQGLVRPSAIAVTVHLPDGARVTDLPEGWSRTADDTVSWGGPALVDSPSFEIRASLG